MPKIYVSGPMTGYDKLNFSAFDECTIKLRELGYEVISPHEVEIDNPDNYDECLRADLREMLTCDAVATLTGWEESRGARLETSVAILVGMPVFSAHELLEGASVAVQQ